MLPYLLLFIWAGVSSYLLAFPVRHCALRFDIVDRPEKRKMHQVPVPLLGGLAIVGAFVATAVPALFLAAGRLGIEDVRPFFGLMAGSAIIVALGIYDDIKGANAPIKFTFQTAAALVVILTGARVENFTNPVGGSVALGWLGLPVAVLWIVGVTNAVNLIDGLDGLAAGIGSIAAIGLFAVSVTNNALIAALAVILAGAATGLLRHNFYPARIFLGDSGSMFIGFCLAVLGIYGSFKASTATVLFLPIIVLGVPIFDTLFAIMRRAKQRVNPFKADREHIHHRLVRIGLHHRSVVLVMYFVCAYLTLTAYSISRFPSETAFLFLVLLTLGGLIGLRTLQFVEGRLETALAVAQERPQAGNGKGNGYRQRQRNGNDGPRGREFAALVCEVGGFTERAVSEEVRASLCEEIGTLLSRRLRVFGVAAEVTSPGRLILIVRTEPLSEPMAALVRDGLNWYLTEQRAMLSSDANFPRIEWLKRASRAGAAAPRGRVRIRSVGDPAVAGAGQRPRVAGS